jgi:hypothetical protein
LYSEFGKNQCALSILRTWESNDVSSRGPLGEVVEGPNFASFKEEVEERKLVTGGFHPHIANRILNQFWGKTDSQETGIQQRTKMRG